MKLLAKSIFLTACLFAATTGFAANVAKTTPAPAAVAVPVAELFTADQKVAIEKIVHNYLLTHPEVLIEVSHALEMKQQAMMQEKAQKIIPLVLAELIHAQNSPVAGNPKSAVSVVEFYDNQCPHCKVMGKEIDALLASNPNIRIVYKELPIFGPDSEFAAKAALAAQRQGKFTVFHNALLNAQGRLNNQIVLDIAKSVGLDVNTLQANMNLPEYAQELKANAALASKLGINGTPAFVIVHPEKDGKVKSVFIPGQTNKDQLLQAVQSIQ
jgi:hypothetical protein